MPAANNPQFSIIIVAYNSGKDMQRLFDCLDAQTNKNFETILIDNASKISPVPIDSQKRANIFISNEENIGFARANNQGAQIANAPWICLLNPDAFPNKDWLEEVAKAIKKYPNCEAFGSLQMLDGFDGILDGAGDCFSISGIAWRGGHRKSFIGNFEDAECFSPCAAAAIWRKNRFIELGGFEESFVSYYEDVDIGFRHRLMGGKSIQLSRAIVQHRGSGSSSRYSDYAVFHGVRNRFWAYIRLMPSYSFWLFIVPHILATLLLWLHASMRGAGKAYSRGLWAGILGLKNAFSERSEIQKTRTIKTWDILYQMSWSPFSLLLRKIVTRKIKP